ncbi:exopolysaccharide biosynthesis protein [Plastoroseomonas hellenica]|nr:exopolysaccharide biosynthesis protein [Plastoroseomonas hellenica]
MRRPTSAVLYTLLSEAAAGRVTIDWLFARLGDRSFGIMLLLLGICGLLPGVSAVAGVLLVVLAFQMIMGRSGPSLPRRVSSRGVSTRQLAILVDRLVPVLRWLERLIRPRWATPFVATRRVVGAVVLLLGASLLVPLPLSNIPPALTIVLLAFAYLEEDGVLLCIALAVAVGLLAGAAAFAWEVMSVAGWLPSLR